MSVQSSTAVDPWWHRLIDSSFESLFSPKLWKAVIFLSLSFPLGLFWFCVLVPGIAAGIGTAVIWIGVIGLAVLMQLWMLGGRAERWRMGVCLDEVLPSPYRPLPEGNWLRRGWERAKDVALWRDLVYLLVLFPVGMVEMFVVGGAVIAPVAMFGFALLAMIEPGIVWGAGRSSDQVAFWAWVVAVIAVAWLLIGQHLILWVARGHVVLARVLMGPPVRLEERVAALSESRSRVVDAAMLDRQRIERDLHDGAQQRLVALAMNLGMAREKMATDPAAAQELVAEAHEEAKRALAEIRDLVRGIYPSVLADRGLDPAISALASRCPVPVTVTVDLNRRLPDVLESTAYFLIAEALANVAKHSRASKAWVNVRLKDDRLLIEIGDNGNGGADASNGTGLVGLAARVNAVDGELTVESPPDGPTTVRGELPVPCES